MTKLRIRDIFRYGRPYSELPFKIDGIVNHFGITKTPGQNKVLLEKGINQIGDTKAIDGKRMPAIIIRSSPHKIGTETTPWQDVFDVDNGHIRYYGDNKVPGVDPAKAPGNKILLDAFEIYNNPEKRHLSVPLIFYKAVSQNNKSKGYIQFNGFGIIKGVELVTQYDRKLDRTFSNYAFSFHVFSLSENHEEFNWDWISDRRDKDLNLTQTLQLAPKSWIRWIKEGNSALEKVRRRVSQLFTKSRFEQSPKSGSQEEKILRQIYEYYLKKKSRFEGLANEVASKIFRDTGGSYTSGWITPSSSDGGADFFGRLDIGIGLGKAKLIVLGQAKCESLNSPTGGNHVARTVARLKRGWIGVYVTTSFFSEAVQREVIEDEYPIMLVNGLQLASTTLKLIQDEGFKDLGFYLNFLDEAFEARVQTRRPDELLFE